MKQHLLEPLEFDVQRLPEKGRTIKFSASSTEKQKIRKEFELLSLDFLNAELKLTRWRRDGIAVKGRIAASLELPCVVSLEPVRQDIDDYLEVLFVKEGSPLAGLNVDANGEIILDPEGKELPETFSGETIRLDEVILEALTLAIDPFPRLPGVEIPEAKISNDDEADQPPSPFAVLAQLKERED